MPEVLEDGFVLVRIFLAAPASDFVNGQILFVDGGITAEI